tara:strand:+ start:2951 stop:3163 length:213 start_codon:yes stop_codon:yes gene_type:complete
MARDCYLGEDFNQSIVCCVERLSSNGSYDRFVKNSNRLLGFQSILSGFLLPLMFALGKVKTKRKTSKILF